MLDAKFVRENLEAVAEAMANRNFSWDSERFVQLDEERRSAIAAAEELQAQRNAVSKSIGKMMGQGLKEEAEEAKAQVRQINEQRESASEKREAAEGALRELLMATPNMPHETTPVGRDENDNPEVRRWGTRASSTSKRRRTGTWVPNWESSTSSAA